MTTIEASADVVAMICANDCCRDGRPKLFVPREMIVGGSVVSETTYGDYEGFFVSPCRSVFCKRDCWARYCED